MPRSTVNGCIIPASARYSATTCSRLGCSAGSLCGKGATAAKRRHAAPAGELFREQSASRGRAIWGAACPEAGVRQAPLPVPDSATPRPLDEPTAAISVRQVAEVLSLIRELRDRGLAIVLVNRRMPDVFSVAGRIVVLRRGMVADRQIAVFGKSPRWASS
jgi:hypothetical protein